ncbi:MAG: HD domain-containing protein [Phycisphaerales bacterium]|nr:HD domain-containing protein [Phycisphaerales bacterium]
MDSTGTRNKLIVITVAVGVIVSIIVFVLAGKMILESQKEEAQGLALVFAESIDPSKVERLVIEKNSSADNAIYKEFQSSTQAIVKSTSMFGIPIVGASILVPTQNSAASGFDFLVSSHDSESQSNSMRVPFQRGDHAIQFEMDGQPAAVTMWNSAEGSWLIGYAPIINVSGKSIGFGVIELNQKTTNFILIKLFLFSIVTGLIVSILASVLLSSIIARQLRPLVEREEHDFLIHLLGEQLSKVTDVDLLLNKILDSSLEFSKCEAGSIWIKDQDQLVLWYARNLVLESRTPKMHTGIMNVRIAITANSIAGYCALRKNKVVLDDVYELSADSPFQFDQSIDKKTGFRTRCMISIPLLGAQGLVLGVMQLINPAGHQTVTNSRLVDRTEGFAVLAGQVLERANSARNLLMRMVRTVEVHDPHETGFHVQRVSGVACHLYKILADKQNIPQHVRDQKLNVLSVAAFLHDIGKVGIPDTILKKRGKLDEHERNVMKWHTVIGAKMFDDSENVLEKAASDVALHHQEHWDGNGYPGAIDFPAYGRNFDELKDIKHLDVGLKGEETPIFARLVGIADVFDALASQRTYKEPWNDEQIKKEIRKGSGTHFDPRIVDIFLENYEDLKAIRERFPNPYKKPPAH